MQNNLKTSGITNFKNCAILCASKLTIKCAQQQQKKIITNFKHDRILCASKLTIKCAKTPGQWTFFGKREECRDKICVYDEHPLASRDTIPSNQELVEY